MTDSVIPTTVTPQVLLVNHFKTLKLPTFAREYEKVGIECAREGVDYARYLLRLCELERIDRERRNTERRIRLAKFSVTKSLDTFDFAAIPGLNKSLVLELMRCEWIDKRENIIALGAFRCWQDSCGFDLRVGCLPERNECFLPHGCSLGA